jgi:hypothetical protein
MGAGQAWSSTGLCIGTTITVFLIYINDLPFSLKKLAQAILVADDTSIIISDLNPEEFGSNIISVFNETMTCFNKNFLTLNFDKTHFLPFFCIEK